MQTRRRSRRTALPAIGLATVLTLAACGGGGGEGESGGSAGQPQKGGTLKFVGKSDVTSMDTAFSYYALNYTIMRGFTRQLVTTPTVTSAKKAGHVVADMATQVPTVANGGISKDKLSYTFTIKKGVKWNTDPARQVTSKDMERGIERLCNPAKPSGALSYYTTTIKGMAEFCDGFSEVDDTADAIANYIKDNDISGIKTPSERKVVFELTQPTPDFLSIMAEYFATPAPKEYLQYVPSSAEFNQHVLSNGPYMVSEYQPNKKIVLERNPAWDPKTDDVRHAYVDKIVVDEGVSQQSAFLQVKTGDADLLWSVPPPTSKLPTLYGKRNLEQVKNGLLDPYIVFNMVSPNEDSATSKLAVRKAIRAAVNKKALLQQFGGPKAGTIACQIMPEASKGHIENYQCPTGKKTTGNPKKAKQLLAKAGYPDGLTLKMPVRQAGVHPKAAQTLQASLKKAGIKLKLSPIPGDDFYSGFLQVAEKAREGAWDIATPGWIPDWQGLNGRSYLQPLFYSGSISKDDKTWGTNYGFYHSEKVNKLIDKATSASSTKEAVAAFTKAHKQILKDVAAIPIAWRPNPQLHSDRVHGFAGFPEIYGDITNMWLEQ